MVWLWSYFSLGRKSQIGFVKRVEHFFTVGFKLSCKLLVKKVFESFVDDCDSHWTAWASCAIPICCAIYLWRASCDNRLSCLSCYLELRSLVPNSKDWAVRNKIGGPFIRLFNHIHIDTILKVFLHICVDKEVKTGEVRKRDELG